MTDTHLYPSSQDTHEPLHQGQPVLEECPRIDRRIGYSVVTTQAIANLGFYAVIPFLAGHLGTNLGMSAAFVGIVLGIRTASQQGLFVVGGTLADHFGPRILGTIGCLVRIAGFLALGLSQNPTGIIVGAILTGLGGALFSPSLEATLSHMSAQREVRREWFARLAAVGELGALAGPVLGGLAFGLSFTQVCLLAAVFFVLLAIIMWCTLPGHLHAEHKTLSLSTALRNRRFVLFAVLFSVQLFAYNQLYYAFPLQAASVFDNPEKVTAVMFICASALVAICQVPMSRALRSVPLSSLIPLGFAVMALAMLVVPAWQSLHLPASIGLILAAMVLIGGHMLVAPTALSAIGDFAGDSPTGAYHGLLASCGGAAVLLGNAAAGPLLEVQEPEVGIPVTGWAALAIVLVLVGACLHFILRVDARSRARERAAHAH